jgi:hypothetical protein
MRHPRTSPDEQIRALEEALRRQRELTEHERRRADALEAQVRIAFRVAGWPARPREATSL